ncbi:hypothetical protein [Tautonia sociabilis]|uniref:Uncharacterized protein n=1 Tax=Tautonia sociabilis TaxID=2080755 RepID=A0A432MI85_9BACT|nr:hypothetical protein [Tautonia sociabilis]RUL86930.1 hypothetical protein TsocGM_14905 [Tautonia sociabilis]
MLRVAVRLLHLYLIFRIVCCPCLTGQNIHDRATLSLFAWGGAASVPSDELGNPDDLATEAGACMCDGASAPSCPDCPPPDRSGSPIDAPDHLLALVSSIGRDGLTDLPPAPPPLRSPEPSDARIVRARLQSFRC